MFRHRGNDSACGDHVGWFRARVFQRGAVAGRHELRVGDESAYGSGDGCVRSALQSERASRQSARVPPDGRAPLWRVHVQRDLRDGSGMARRLPAGRQGERPRQPLPMSLRLGRLGLHEGRHRSVRHHLVVPRGERRRGEVAAQGTGAVARCAPSWRGPGVAPAPPRDATTPPRPFARGSDAVQDLRQLPIRLTQPARSSRSWIAPRPETTRAGDALGRGRLSVRGVTGAISSSSRRRRCPARSGRSSRACPSPRR